MKESKAKKTERIKAVLARLDEQYGTDVRCYLTHTDAWQLLVAVILSAQCTDARVNMVTPALFERFPTVDDFAEASYDEVAEYIKSCGLFKTKSKDIVEMCKKLRADFGGEVPDTIEALTTLPGVGRKTANLICGDIFGKPAVVVDTHCIRITSKLGLHKQTDQKKIETELKKLLPPEESNDFCHRLVLHGRAVCTARSPKCRDCCMNSFCRTGVKELRHED